jgi:transcriptional regulator with XRE-family HTH domain
MPITTAQIRGARGVLNWSQNDLSARTGISATSIGSIENGITSARESTLIAFKKAFEDAGIEFFGNDGIRKKSFNVDILKGVEGFKSFSNDVRQISQQDDRDILQAYVDDKKFAKFLENEAVSHVVKLEKTKKKNFKIIQKEGDTYFPAREYAEYRWIPEEQFIAVPFVVYGDKFAIILFDPEPTIIVMNYPILAQAYRMQFKLLWEVATLPPKELIENWRVPDHLIKQYSDRG